jgi:hypothetical protein
MLYPDFEAPGVAVTDGMSAVLIAQSARTRQGGHSYPLVRQWMQTAEGYFDDPSCPEVRELSDTASALHDAEGMSEEALGLIALRVIKSTDSDLPFEHIKRDVLLARYAERHGLLVPQEDMVAVHGLLFASGKRHFETMGRCIGSAGESIRSASRMQAILHRGILGELDHSMAQLNLTNGHQNP